MIEVIDVGLGPDLYTVQVSRDLVQELQDWRRFEYDGRTIEAKAEPHADGTVDIQLRWVDDGQEEERTQEARQRGRQLHALQEGQQEGHQEEEEPEGSALVKPYESIAREFHAEYERLAPFHGYETREASAKPWEDVPANNRELMQDVVLNLCTRGVILPGPKASG